MAFPVAEPLGAAPDFKIFTGAMEIGADGTPTHLPIVRMVGSSTEQDLHGDTMTSSALESMCDVTPGLLIWLNHDYSLPDSLFGSLCDAPELIRKMGVTDLRLAVEVEMSNPNAARTYAYIQRDLRLGCSVGCQVLEYQIPGVDQDDDEEMFWALIMGAPIEITRVKAVEWSVVGIPANQRSWVENAIKGVFKRNLDLRLAPAVKSMFPIDYAKIVKGIEDPDLRQKYLDAPARGSKGELKWDLNRNTFEFRDLAGRTKSLGRDDVASVIQKSAHNFKHKAADDSDKAAQEARAKKSGIGVKEGGNVTKPSEWKDVPDSEWGDYTNYRYPMPDESHARNALSRWGDASNRKQYNEDEQSIIEGRIHRRCKELGIDVNEDGDKEKSVEGNTEKTGDDLVTKSDMPRAAAVMCDSEGNHEPCVGTHTHMCMGMDGAMHESTHSHDGDNSHEPDDNMGGTMPGDAATSGAGDGNINPPKSAPLPQEFSADEREILMARYNALGSVLGFDEHKDGSDAIENKMPDVSEIEALIMKAFNIVKEGREFSAENRDTLQHVHDSLNTMCDGMLCQPTGTQTTQQAEDQAKQSRDEGTDLNGYGQTLALSVERISKAIEDLGIEALRSEVRFIQQSLTEAQQHAKDAATSSKNALAEANGIHEVVKRLQDMPMGRPTNFNRSLKSADGAAQEADFTVLGNAANGIEGTEIVLRKDTGTCRHWPAGVMKEARPNLGAEQLIIMSNTEIAAYYAGEEAFVPHYE